jgi:hypothetical protein
MNPSASIHDEPTINEKALLEGDNTLFQDNKVVQYMLHFCIFPLVFKDDYLHGMILGKYPNCSGDSVANAIAEITNILVTRRSVRFKEVFPKEAISPKEQLTLPSFANHHTNYHNKNPTKGLICDPKKICI